MKIHEFISDEINKETNISEVVAKYPETAKVFMDYGLHCVGCMASQFDTIEQGAKTHGMDDETIKELVKDLKEFTGESLKTKS